jgi:hypothetical protein
MIDVGNVSNNLTWGFWAWQITAALVLFLDAILKATAPTKGIATWLRLLERMVLTGAICKG